MKFSFDDISTKRTLDFTKNELKRLNFEKIAKDKKYQNEHNCLINANGIILPNINTINNSFIRILESLEIEGKLIDETTKQ